MAIHYLAPDFTIYSASNATVQLKIKKFVLLLERVDRKGIGGGLSSIPRRVSMGASSHIWWANRLCQLAKIQIILRKDMSSPLLRLDSVCPSWKDICDKYDNISAEIPQHYSSEEKAAQKEESIFWEQTALELMITCLVNAHIPFDINADDIQKNVKTTEGRDKEIDFSIRIKNQEIYFGVTSFSDRDIDFEKDKVDVTCDIQEIRYPDETVSNTAKLISHRPAYQYLNRRLVTRVAREGKHRLDSDYIYIAFPKIAAGFGGGLDAISKDFSFDGSNYDYKENGITGLVLIGEYINIQHRNSFIDSDIWLVKATSFSHASPVIQEFLAQLDNITINIRPSFDEIQRTLSSGLF